MKMENLNKAIFEINSIINSSKPELDFIVKELSNTLKWLNQEELTEIHNYILESISNNKFQNSFNQNLIKWVLDARLTDHLMLFNEERKIREEEERRKKEEEEAENKRNAEEKERLDAEKKRQELEEKEEKERLDAKKKQEKREEKSRAKEEKKQSNMAKKRRLWNKIKSFLNIIKD